MRCSAVSILRWRCSSASFGANAGPQRVRVLAAELADALQFEPERRRRNRGERVLNGGGIASVHFADEAQGQVKLVAR